MHQLVKKVFLPSWWRESKLSTIRNGRFAALAELACGPPLLIGLTSRCFAHWARASCAPATATSTIRNGRLAAPDGLQYFLAHWAYYGLFPPQAAAFARPSPVSAKILRISGRGNCKEAIFALENGIFRRKNRPAPAVHAAGDDFTARGLRLSRALLGFWTA